MSIRECNFCKESGVNCKKHVTVNPYYSYNIRSIKSPIDLSIISYLDIEESFICPICGNKNVNNYEFTPTGEDLHYYIDKKLEREGKLKL